LYIDYIARDSIVDKNNATIRSFGNAFAFSPRIGNDNIFYGYIFLLFFQVQAVIPSFFSLIFP